MISNIPDMYFISAQPHDDFFVWQIEVQMHNFREKGISHRAQVLVWYPDTLNQNWKKLEARYPEVKFYYYKNQGAATNLYLPIIRPHILKMHFYTHSEELKRKPIFYHDADIIFRELPDFNTLCSDINVYESDTISYVGAEYFKYKAREAGLEEDHVIKGLASLVNLDHNIIINNNDNSGGAQYLLKHIDHKFWEDVERDCLLIRDYLSDKINRQYFRSEAAGYQSWCSDMWAVNFNLWKRGIPTRVTSEMDFSWATDAIETYNQKNIFHNAGVTDQMRGYLFFKGDFTRESPFGKDFSYVKPTFASIKYVEYINKIDPL